MATKAGNLQVSVVEGKGLKPAGDAASADPYVRLTLGTQEVRQAGSSISCSNIKEQSLALVLGDFCIASLFARNQTATTSQVEVPIFTGKVCQLQRRELQGVVFLFSTLPLYGAPSGLEQVVQ
jgi:hypothetical protein